MTPLSAATPRPGETEALQGDPVPTVTGETLFRQRVERQPNALALADAEDRSDESLSPGRPYSYGQAERAITGLARLFADHGLSPGEIVGVQMPNVAETVLVYLAAWRAGLTVAAFPYLWRGLELAEACAQLQPAALIGGGRGDGEALADRLRKVAVEHFCVRMVAGFGADLPDGVTPLDAALAGEEGGSFAPYHSFAPALIGFTARPGRGLVPVAHGQDDLLAQGAMAVLALSLNGRDRLLNPFPLSGATGLGFGLMPWLIAGGSLIQHQPFDFAAFRSQLVSFEVTAAALPLPYLRALAEDGILTTPECKLRRLGRVLFGCGPFEALPPKMPTAPRLFDLYPLGDLACLFLPYAAARDAQQVPRGDPAFGGKTASGAKARQASFIETARGRAIEGEPAELMLGGPAVPKGQGGLPADGRGLVGTGLRCRPDANNAAVLRLEGDAELIRHGAFSIAASELDALFSGFPACEDAAAFSLPDPVMGERILAAVVPKPGQTATLVSLNWYLNKRELAPFKLPEALINVAFIPRDREGAVLRLDLARQAKAMGLADQDAPRRRFAKQPA
jgi:acyl-CoA synthetase (AMP-forming)/AMP-acid ligase II